MNSLSQFPQRPAFSLSLTGMGATRYIPGLIRKLKKKKNAEVMVTMTAENKTGTALYLLEADVVYQVLKLQA